MEANAVIRARHSFYQTELDGGNNIRIQNIQNTLSSEVPTNHRFRVANHQLKTNAEALKQAWGLDRLKELDEKAERLSMVYRLSSAGKILEIEFVIQGIDTSISIQELETLENVLKDTVSYDVLWEGDQQDVNYAFTLFAVPFRIIISLLGEAKVGYKITQVILTPPPLRDLE